MWNLITLISQLAIQIEGCETSLAATKNIIICKSNKITIY